MAEMRRRGLRDRAGDIRRGWCGGRDGWHVPSVMAAQAVRSRRAGCAPRDRTADAFAASYSVRTGQVPQRWIGLRQERNAREALKSLSTGGPTEQASNTARGTPDDRRTCGSKPSRQASVSRGAEVRGSNVTPAFRAPSFIWRRPGTRKRSGGPAPAHKIRTAQRWLRLSCPRKRASSLWPPFKELDSGSRLLRSLGRNDSGVCGLGDACAMQPVGNGVMPAKAGIQCQIERRSPQFRENGVLFRNSPAACSHCCRMRGQKQFFISIQRVAACCFGRATASV